LTSESAIIPANANQIKLYSNYLYTPKKSDASDASDALNTTVHKIQDRKSKAEQVGKPELPCIYCDFSDCIEFDPKDHNYSWFMLCCQKLD
jgi:hypothetical protein